MKLLPLLAVLLLTVPAFGSPENCIPAAGVTNIDGGFAEVDPYQPIPITSFRQVPKHIRQKVLRHLANRLGAELLSRLTFQEGEIIDHHRLYRDNPEAKDYKWVVPTYILNFVFSDHAKGIASYCAQIGLSSSGDVVDEVNLPDMHKYRPPYSMTSLGDAAQIAFKKGFSPSKICSDICYVEGIDAVAWQFSEVVADDGIVMKIHYIDIDVYSGKELENFYGSTTR